MENALEKFNELFGLRLEKEPTKEEVILLIPFVSAMMMIWTNKVKDLRLQKSNLIAKATEFTSCEQALKGIDALKGWNAEIRLEEEALQTAVTSIGLLGFPMVSAATDVLQPVEWTMTGEMIPASTATATN